MTRPEFNRRFAELKAEVEAEIASMNDLMQKIKAAQAVIDRNYK